MNHRLAAVAALLAALVAASACSSSGGSNTHSSSSDPTTSSRTSSSTSPTSSPPAPPQTSRTSASPTSPADIAEQQATALIPTYLAEIDKLYSDPTVSINNVYNVAVAPEATAEALAIARFRGASDRQTGAQKLIKVSVVSVKPAGLGGTSANAKYPAVKLTACVDVSGVAATDAKGKSLVPPTRPKYLIDSLTIVNIKFPASASWRVSDATNKQAASCRA